MKKFAYLLFVVTLFCVTACKKKDLKSQVVGTWEVAEGTDQGNSFTFTEDGKFTLEATVEDQTVSVDGTYTVDVEAKSITFDFTQEDLENQQLTDVKVDGKTLTAKDADGGETMTLQKK